MNEFGFVADNEINDNFGFVADVEEVKTQPVKQPTQQTRTYPNQPVKNMTEEEFKKNVDKIYDIPQVDIPQRGVLVNSNGEQNENWFDNLVIKSENWKEQQNQRAKELAKENLKKRAEWEEKHPIISGIQKDYQTNIGIIPSYRGQVPQWELQAKYGLEAPLKEQMKTDLKTVGLNLAPSTNIAVEVATGGGGKVAKEGLKQLIKEGAKQGAKTGAIGGLTQGITSSLADNGISADLLTRPLSYATGGLLGGALLGGFAPVAIKGVEKVVGKIAKPKPQPQVTKEVKAEVVEQPVKQVEEVVESVPQQTEQPKVNLNTLKSNIRANKFEQSNMKDYYTVNKGKKGFNSTLTDPVSRDIELSQREFNNIITEISKNPEKLNDSVYMADLENRVQQIIDKTPYGNEAEVATPYWEKFWKAVDDGYNYNEFKTKSTGQLPEDIKKRSLQQSVLEAKGTPKEVKEIIKEDIPTYEVMHNKDLIKQATQELEGNFDNELVRLASAKDFDALDYEKSHQIARQLFGMGDYQRAGDLIDNVSENATKKGQAIQALSLWSNMTPEGAVYKAQKLLKEYNKKHPKKQIQLTDENIETIANLQKEALNTTDELARNQALARSVKYISELVPKNALQKLKAYRNISLLLNPKTLGRNIVGNALFNAIDTSAKALAVPIDRAIGLATKQQTRVVPSLKTYGKGLSEGAKTGYQEALQGIDTRGLGQRFDLGSGRTFVGGNTERTTLADIINAQQGNKLDTTKQYFQELLPKSRIGQAITQRSLQPLKQIPSDFMNSLETTLDVGLRTPDRAFYEATFAESVDNIMRAKGLTEPTQEVLKQAEQEALESVFQNQSKLSDTALWLRKGLNRLIGTKDFGAGDVLIPYAQTPANLAQQGINYSPFGAIKGIANLAQGKQRQASLDFARSLLGTGLIGGGYGLSKAGLMTPSQFDDNYQTNKKIRENLQPLGIRPDQLGDMWYAPFQPMSIPLAVGNAVAYGKDPLQAGINTVVDLPFLQGISRGLRDLQEGNYAQAGINVASSIPSQFVPTLGSQIAQTIDPYQRETYDPNKLQYGLNSAIAKVPFASKTLPEKIDVTGQPIERYSTKGGQKLFDIFLNPTFINKKTTDPVLSELKYIYDQTKETSHFMPSVKKKLEFTDVEGNPQKLVLTGREFSEYQRRLGQRMYNEFDYIMDLPEYANADEYGKIKILEKAKKLVQAEVDNEMWNKRNRNKKRSYTKGN